MAFRKAKQGRIGGKFLSYGLESSGKSMFQLTFPCVACEDSETGIAHYEGRDITLNNGVTYNNLVMVDNSADLDALEENLDDLLSGEYDDQIKTFSIDSETKFYNTMQLSAQEIEEKRARKKGGDVDDANISQRSWGKIKVINMKLQQAKIDLSARGIHVVSIAQANEIKDEDNKKVIGYKPDMHKSVKFDYDTILRHYTTKDKDGTIHYYAEVQKDRTNVTKIGDIIENPTYDIWKSYYDSMNGLDVIQTSYRKDIDTSTKSLEDETIRVEELVVEWKKDMKSINENKDIEAIKKINALIKEKGIDVKKIDLSALKDMQEIYDLTRSLI